MSTTTVRKQSPAALAEALEREPLICVTAASRLLGIKAPNFRRDAQPHLIGVPVEGGANVYFRSQVEELARQRQRRNGNGA